MKKLLAIIMAVAMLLAVGVASATTGWSNSTDAKTYKNFSVSIVCYEGREDSSGLALSDYVSGGAANEVTGRVVIGTTVVIVVKVVVPKLENTDLIVEDYVNAKLNLTFGNLDVTGTATTLAGASPNFYTGSSFLACETGSPATLLESATTVGVNTTDEDYDVTMDVTNAASNTSSVTYKIAIVGQAKTTAECPVTATFTMGQDCSKSPYYVEFDYNEKTYEAGFCGAEPSGSTVTFDNVHNYFALLETNTDSVLYFSVNSSNKLSKMRFIYNGGTTYSIDACGDCGALQFTDSGVDYCVTCDDTGIAVAMQKVFNRLINTLGFDYTVGSMDYGYATKSDVNGLANQVKVAAGYTFNECTELAVVDIPQTGSFAYGFAAVALAIVAGAAVAIRKLRA